MSMIINPTLFHQQICYVAHKFNSIFAQTRYCLKIHYQKTALADAVAPLVLLLDVSGMFLKIN